MRNDAYIDILRYFVLVSHDFSQNRCTNQVQFSLVLIIDYKVYNLETSLAIRSRD